MAESKNVYNRKEKIDITMGMKCINCRRKLTNFIENTDQFTNQSFKIWQCAICGIGQTEITAGADLSLYYPKQYYGDKNIRFNPIVEYLIRIFRRLRARQIHKFTGLNFARVLDIGCGRGLMLAELKRYGWECFGIERSNTASEYARDVIGIKVETTGDLISCSYPSGDFDVICMWHVLEHIQDPLTILKEIKRILKIGGFLIIEIPNFTSWQAKISQGKWIYTEAPRHIFHFSPEGLNAILKQNGFNRVSSSTCSLEFGPFGMIQSLLNLFCPIPNFLFFLLGNRHRRAGHILTAAFIYNTVITFVLLIPCTIIGIAVEIIACLFGKGGVYRAIYTTST